MKELDEILDIYVPKNTPNRSAFRRRLEGLIAPQKLSVIGERMAHQDLRGSSSPLFVVQEDCRQWVESGMDYDESERVEDPNEAFLCEECTETLNEGYDLPDQCSECDDDAFDHYKIGSQFAIAQVGVFLTAEACEQHIVENAHHYTNPRSYAISAWRNPEIISVMQHLLSISGNGDYSGGYGQ